MILNNLLSLSKLVKRIPKYKKKPITHQIKVLTKLLKKARFTEFGQHYNFDTILHKNNIALAFQAMVPIFNYDSIFSQWWYKTMEGKSDICWPKKIKYYALSSGTSGTSSKYIPITKDLLKDNKSVMIKQLLSLLNYQNVPLSSVGKGWLTLTGSTDLQKNDFYFSGDLSGITVKKSPFWFQPFYKPGRKIAKEKDWNKKLEEIVLKAPQWDIGFIVGVPAWVMMCMELILKKYQLETIHQIWPNFSFFVHGGVNFEPYKKSFEKMLGKKVTYVETYLASEGFLAYQEKQDTAILKLVLNQHIFFEFIPFNDDNFDSEGEIKNNPTCLLINQVEEKKDYAILISTNAGAWRYLIGDTIQFVDKISAEIIITGRTKQFLSLVGEHLSIDNMNQAILLTTKELNIHIPEFAIAGEENGNLFAHHWYIATNDDVHPELLITTIDKYLKQLNDDYGVERKTNLSKLIIDIYTENDFLKYLEMQNKVGGQQKFPRVLKKELLKKWLAFTQQNPSKSNAVLNY